VSDTPEETARKQQLLEEIWELEEQIDEQMSANNSSTNEVINNSNKTEVTNIVNKIVKCDCNHDGAEGQLRGIRTGVIGEDDSETGLVWGWELLPEEGEPALFTGGQWVSLMPLVEGEQK
jgi:hypothetical protein